MRRRKKGRLTMKYLREVIRLYNLGGLSNRQIAKACNVSPTTAGGCINKYIDSGIPYETFAELPDEKLESIFYPKEPDQPVYSRPMPDMEYLCKELKRKGVTLQLLWEEYISENPGGYSRSQFSYHYQQWSKKINPTMRFNHKAGEKVFVDFSGYKPEIVNPITGEVTSVDLFVATLGASSYTYAVCVPDQTKEFWIEAHVKMFDFFGGVPECIVPDNLKSGVTSPCFYDPDINPGYADMAAHYGIAVVPARPGKPKDKGKVENGVLNVQRRILAVLRNRTFNSIQELNSAVAEELVNLNDRPMQHMKSSRRQLFEELDQPALKPLPAERFEQYSWKKAKVSFNYHVQVGDTHYSVPWRLMGETVDVKYNSRIVQILHKNKCIASHPRSFKRGYYATSAAHMPPNHQFVASGWTPERINKWASKAAGAYTAKAIDAIIDSRQFPEQAYKSCMGIMKLSKYYPPERLEKACRMVLESGTVRYNSIKSILEKGLDKIHYLEGEPRKNLVHENIRGNEYYRIKGDD